MKKSRLPILILFAISIVACSTSPTPTPFVLSTATPTLTATPMPATATLPPAPTNLPTLPPVPPSVTPASSITPSGGLTTKRIQFAPGGTSATVQGTVPVNGTDRYVLNAQAGQTISLNLTTAQGQAVLAVSGVNGTVLVPDRLGLVQWNGQLPLSQDYVVDVKTVGSASATYTLQVTIPPLGSPTPPPQTPPKRIQFAPGSTSASLSGTLAANTIDQYVLRVLAGQTLSVNVSSTQAKMLLSIAGADGQPYKTMGAGTSNFSFVVPATQDYFIAIATETGTPANYTVQVTIPPLSAEPTRISFAPGGTSAMVQGTLAAFGLNAYVIRAQAGQTMTVNLTTNPAGKGFLVIYGADGDVLISDHAGAQTWSGVLRTTQDYNIHVRTGDTAASYTMQVTIPPK